VLKLKRDTTELDLLAAVGAGWRAGSWNPAVAQMRYGGRAEPVVEVIEAVVERSSHDDLAASVQALDAMAFWADGYVRDGLMQEPVWLHAKMTNEASERRALVRRIDYEWLTPAVSATGYAKKNRGQMRITIEREAYWERTAYCDSTPVTLPGSAAALYDYTLSRDIVGDVDARVNRLWITSAVGHSNRLWVGVRSSNKIDGNAANLEPIWECEDGVNNVSESGIVDVTNTGASPGGAGGKYVKVSEIDLNWDNEWHRVYSETFAQVTSNYTDNYGVFLWLLRGRVTSGTWEIGLRFGHSPMSDDEFIRKEPIEILATSWDFHEIAMQQLPIRNLQVPSSLGVDGQLEIQVWARRVSGSGDLHLDCLCPVPVDEAFLYAENMDTSTTAACAVAQSSFGEQSVITYDTPGQIKAFGWCNGHLLLPPGDGRMVVVYAREASSVLTDKIILNVRHYERWASLRGSE
jgi:hypothetical protein